MKKLVSILLALVMLLSLVPVALAEEGNVAQVGETGYATLAEAIEAVADGGTVTLLAAVTDLDTIKITGGKKVDLNLNGKSITFNADNHFTVDNGALNVTGAGKISSSHGNDDNTWLPTIYAYGTDTNKADYSVVTIGKDVVIDNQGSYGLAIGHSNKKAYGAKVIVNGTVTSTYGFTVTGNATATDGNIPEITVTESGKIETADGSGIYAAGYGVYNIAGTLSGTEFGIEIRAGKLNVANTAKISATGNFSDPVPNGNGSTVTGAAIAVSQHTTNLPIEVNIKGGEISETGKNGYALYEIDTVKNETAENVSKDVSITVSGGSFNGNVYSTNKKLTITGGSFSSDPSAYVAAGYKAVNANGTYTVKILDEAKVAAIGNVKYDTLAEAVAAVKDNETITLLDNVTLSGDLAINNGKTFTIDLNGKTLGGADLFINGSAFVTAKNGTISGDVWLKTTDKDQKYNSFTLAEDAKIETAGYGIVVTQIAVGANNYGSVVDIQGSVTGKESALWVLGNIKTDLKTAKNPVTVTVGPKAKLINNDAAKDSTSLQMAGACVVTVADGAQVTGGTAIEVRAGNLTVNGGIITGTGTPTEVKPNGNGSSTKGAGIGIAQHTTKLPINVTVSGGTISGHTAFLESNPQGNDEAAQAGITLSVAGGKFEAINGGTNAVSSESGKTGFITGGTFSVNPIDYVQKGYAVTKVKDNEFTVAPVKDTAAVEVTNNSDAGKTSVTIDTITPDNASGGDTNTIDISSLDTGKPTNEIKVNESQLNQIMNPTATKPVEFKLSSKLSVAFSAAAAQNIASQSGFTGEIILTVTPNATVTGTELTAKNSVANAKSQVVTVTLTGGASGATPAELYAAATAKGKVTITVPFDMTGYNRLNVYYLDPTTGKAVHVGRATYDTNAGTATFDVEHFSSYVLVPGKSSSGGGSSSGSGSVGSGAHTVTSDLTGTITKVTVDGKTVASKHYTVSGGNVTFTEAFMKTLSNGTHKVTIETATKIARGTFTVDNGTKPVVSSKTGDAGIALYAGMALASVMGGGLVLTSRKRRSH